MGKRGREGRKGKKNTFEIFAENNTGGPIFFATSLFVLLFLMTKVSLGREESST